MATIQGFTKERMIAMQNATIVSGLVDGDGNLILTKHDGTPVNAGTVRSVNLVPATTDVPGVVELATLAEMEAGSDPALVATVRGVRQERQYVSTYTGIVAPGWSGGMPTVSIDAGQAVSGNITALLPGNDDQGIIAGARVLMTRTNLGQWVILNSISTRPAFMRPVYLQLRSGYVLYTDVNSSDGTFGPYWGGWGNAGATSTNNYSGKLEAFMTSTGIVQVHGLLRRISFPGAGALIATLPIGMRPARDQLFNTMSDTGAAVIVVEVDGSIRQVSGGVTYLATDNIRFRAQSAVDRGDATWVDGAPYLVNGYMGAHTAPYVTGGGTDHTFGYTIDADGVVLFEGALRVIANSPDSSSFARMTGLFVYPNAAHFVGPGSAAGTNSVRFGPNGVPAGANGNYLNYSVALAAGQWFSVAHIILLNPASTTTETIAPQGQAGWVRYSADWRPPGFATTPDGLCIAFGLWGAGTIGQPAVYAPVGSRPKYKRILMTVAADAVARQDIGGLALNGEYKLDGQITPAIGSNVWWSMDGLSWVANH